MYTKKVRRGFFLFFLLLLSLDSPRWAGLSVLHSEGQGWDRIVALHYLDVFSVSFLFLPLFCMAQAGCSCVGTTHELGR
jgi:hypothetical protein